MKETIEEFLARGGKITTINPQESSEAEKPTLNIIKSTKLMDIHEGGLYFSDAAILPRLDNKVKSNKKSLEGIKINRSLIPKELHYLVQSKEDALDEEDIQTQTIQQRK